jgi:hypothetical protein
MGARRSAVLSMGPSIGSPIRTVNALYLPFAIPLSHAKIASGKRAI